jgi:hypothetical protein
MADYNLTGCIGTIVFTDGPLIPNNWAEQGEWPVWANLSGGVITVMNTQLGVTNLTIYNTLDEEQTASVQITTTNCYEEVDECLGYPLNVFWLNPEGGFSSYVFNAKKIFGVDIGDSKTYKDADLITRYSNINNIYDTVIQASGFIDETHVDLLKSLRYSVQAWVYVYNNGLEDDEVKEIFNYTKSFELKRQGTGFFKYDFEFSYSKELLTQNG